MSRFFIFNLTERENQVKPNHYFVKNQLRLEIVLTKTCIFCCLIIIVNNTRTSMINFELYSAEEKNRIP